MVAVITGASGGIGRTTAKAFVAAGYDVICLSRRPCDVDGVTSIPCDITKENDIDSAFEKIEKIDVLVNNAGFGISGAAEFTLMDEIRSQFELNVFAHIAVTQKALPKLKEQGKSYFCFICRISIFYSFSVVLFGYKGVCGVTDLCLAQ